MKRLNTILFLIFILITNVLVKSQSVVIDGNSFLEFQNNNSNIKIIFLRVAPTTIIDSTHSDINGYYNINIQTGIYNIYFSKQGFFSDSIIGKPLYSNTTLQNITLPIIGLSGQLTGVLSEGTYKVGGNIYIPVNDTLIINPGVTMLFTQDVVFEISGLIFAVGTEDDSIIFSKFDTSNNWNGIDFKPDANNNSILEYCRIEHSKSSGICIENSSPTLSNLIISKNTKGTDFTGLGYHSGGGISLYYSNAIIKNSKIYENSAFYGAGIGISGKPILSNLLIYNNNAIHSGGGISIGNSEAFLENLIISNNFSNLDNSYGGQYAAGGISGSSSYTMVNSIISNNVGYGIVCSSYGTPANIYNNTFFNNSTGNFVSCNWLGVNVTTNNNGTACDAYKNIQTDPLYVDPSVFDFHLTSNSPCIDAGINDSVSTLYDFENNIRIWDGNYDTIPIVDMGAYEYNSNLYTNSETLTKNNALSVNAFPNPCYDNINIKANNCSEITLTNTLGQNMFQNKYNNLQSEIFETIDITTFPKGIYLVKCVNKNESIVKKIIKL
ncbi:MAG: hypothetical protein A2033_09040 [Bacteroidetes bacterium GWA2_31_9]|nr:MAG: hypothetical protein A2033_09040 [Bacteroidetes bacterium GWA2_31_9]